MSRRQITSKSDNQTHSEVSDGARVPGSPKERLPVAYNLTLGSPITPMPGCHPASLFPPRRPLWAVIGSGPEEEEGLAQLLEEGRRGRRRFDLIRGFRVAASAGAAYSVSRPYLMRRHRGSGEPQCRYCGGTADWRSRGARTTAILILPQYCGYCAHIILILEVVHNHNTC